MIFLDLAVPDISSRAAAGMAAVASIVHKRCDCAGRAGIIMQGLNAATEKKGRNEDVTDQSTD